MIYYLSIVLLFALLAMFWMRYRWASVAHPAVWFAIAHVAQAASYWAAVAVGFRKVYNEQVLDRLGLCIAATGASFALASLATGTQRRETPGLRLGALPENMGLLSSYFSVISIVGAIVNVAFVGVDMAGIEARRQQWLQQIPTITARMFYPYMLAYVAAFVCGWEAVAYRAGGVKSRHWLWFTLPAVSGLLWTLGTGGRQAFGLVLLYYGVGGACGLAARYRAGLQIPRALIVRLGSVFLGTLVGLAIVVSATARIRADYFGTVDTTGVQSIPIARQFASFVFYMADGPAAYQIKAETEPDELGWGMHTFGVLEEVYLDRVLGWRMETSAEVRRDASLEAQRGALLVHSVPTVFYDFQRDFGFTGGLAVASLLALLSHLLFRQWYVDQKRSSLVSQVPLCMAIMFWAYSGNYSLLRHDTLKWMILSFVALDTVRCCLRGTAIRSKTLSP